MTTTHTRIYKETLKEIKILAATEEMSMLKMMKLLVDEYKQSKEESNGKARVV